MNVVANFILKAEYTPLFKWDLYSFEIPQQNIYSFLEVRYNKDRVLTFPHTFNEPEKLFFTNTLDLFIYMKRNHNTDPLKTYIDNYNKNHPVLKEMMQDVKLYNDTTELNKFPAWYKRYLEQHIHAPVYSIDVYEVKAAYRRNGEITKVSSTLIYKLL